MTNGTRGRNESSVPTGDIFPRVTRLMIRLYAVARTHASRHFFFSFSFFFFARARQRVRRRKVLRWEMWASSEHNGAFIPLYPSRPGVEQGGIGRHGTSVIARNFYRVIVGWKG